MSHGKSSRSGSSKQPPHQGNGGHWDQVLPSRPFSLPPGYYDYYGIPRPEPAPGSVQAKRLGLNQGPPIPRGILEYYGIVQRAASDSAPGPMQQKEEVKAATEPETLPTATVAAPTSIETGTVQAKSDGSASKSETELVHEAAAHGTGGASGVLPYLDEIQSSFGKHDVSHIKAHTDSHAAAGASAMGAEAFTKGDHVAFAGSPSLHTAAHEAAHVIQQKAGVQLKGGVGEVGDRYEQHADAVADRVVRGQSSESLLDEHLGQGHGHGLQRSTPDAALPAEMARRAQPDPRTSEDGIKRHSDSFPASSAVQKEEIDYKKEFDSLSFKGHIEGGLEGYKNIRAALLATFGRLEQASTYFKSVVNVSFLGRSPMVHKATLGGKLATAEQLLKTKGWYDAIVATTPAVGGFNIRKNRNNNNQLSDHSFGWAIDIDANLNPNIKNFPAGVVKAIAGEGMFAGQANEQLAAGGTAEELLPWAQRMHDASEHFREAFADLAALKKAMIEYLTDRLGMSIKDDQLDLERVKKAAGAANKAQMAEFQALVAVLAGTRPDLAKAATQQADEYQEDYIEKNGAAKWGKEKTRLEAAEKKKQEQRQAEVKADSQGVFPPGVDQLFSQYVVEDTNEVAEKAAHMLVEMYRIYKSSFSNEKKGTRKPPVATGGDAGTVAANGFINLQPTLIAALTGSDGGDLQWLGNASGTKDFMHFQLKAGDHPALK